MLGIRKYLLLSSNYSFNFDGQKKETGFLWNMSGYVCGDKEVMGHCYWNNKSVVVIFWLILI